MFAREEAPCHDRKTLDLGTGQIWGYFLVLSPWETFVTFLDLLPHLLCGDNNAYLFGMVGTLAEYDLNAYKVPVSGTGYNIKDEDPLLVSRN